MELNKAIEILKENRDVAKHRADGLEKNKLTDFVDIQYKIDKEDYEAIDTVLTELDKLQKESISKDKIIDKIKEIQLEYDNRSRDNDSFYAYSNEYAHIEEVLRELLEEGNNEQV